VQLLFFEEEKPPYLPIYRHTWESKVERRERERTREKVRGCQEQQPCCLVQQCRSHGSWVWVKWSSSSMCVVILSLSDSNNIDFSRGCRRFCRTTLNIVLVCLSPPFEQLSVHPRSAHGGAGIPNISFIQTHFQNHLFVLMLTMSTVFLC
jgi:hypothetical protein